LTFIYENANSIRVTVNIDNHYICFNFFIYYF